MATEPIHMPADQHLDYQMVAQILEGLKKEQSALSSFNVKLKTHAEMKQLKFWRAIISECLASFLYVFIVCGAAAGAGIGASVSSVLLTTSLASGLSMAVLTHCFLHISGAHINPAVTFACGISKKISWLRTLMYILAQLGGGIAGAFLLYAFSLPGYQGNLQAAISHSSAASPLERFFVEIILTFLVVLTYFVSTRTHRRIFGNSAMMIGAAYAACNFVSMPYLNVARSLGPAVVLKRWDGIWCLCAGSALGGLLAAVLFGIFCGATKSNSKGKDSEESSSVNSDEDINFDLDIEKSHPLQPKFHAGNFNTYRSAPGAGHKQMGPQNMCQTMYQTKVDRVESIYGGTRSLYCKSPSLTRANLNRSQSVYTKSNTAVNRENGVVRAGPLVPAQSLYPLRVAASSQQNSHLQNQNVQNQLQQRSENIYGIRGSMRQSTVERMPERQMPEPTNFQTIYPNQPEREPREVYEQREEPVKYTRRPDSVYGMTNRRIQSAQSDDSSYGSYHGSSLTPPTRGTPHNGNFQPATGSMMGQQQKLQQTYGMLPLPNPPTHTHQQQQIPNQQQPQQHQQQHQNERKLSTSTTSSLPIQRSVEFKDFTQKGSSGHPSQSPLPPPPPQHQNYQMHPIRQN